MLFGFLNCDKPPGMTSRDLVNIVQRRLHTGISKGEGKLKVGHCGTLDPLATGVVVIAVGSAVRLTPYMLKHSKRYIGQFRLAASSETGDLEMGFKDHPELPKLNRDQVQQACEKLTGEIQQVPPAYSAIWVDGQRAYDRVRRGESVEIPTRTVQIHDLRLTEFDYPSMTLDIVCGSGTYIRTLGDDVAKAAGSLAVMTDLRRIGVGDFRIDQAITIDELRNAPLEPYLLPGIHAVTHLEKRVVNRNEVDKICNGICIPPSSDAQMDCAAEVAAVTESGELIAILRSKPRGLCPYRVFPPS